MIIVGLGNPGQDYHGTRHNVGFAVLDAFVAGQSGAAWKLERGVQFVRLGEHWLIKPCEFMNVSGSTLRSFAHAKHLAETDAALAAQLVIIHDDLDFPLGEVRHQFDRSAAGHNGVRSIIDAFHTQKFGQLRIGIGDNRQLEMPAENYVLLPFTDLERPVIGEAINQAVRWLEAKLAVAD